MDPPLPDLSRLMIRDEHRLRRRLDGLRRGRGGDPRDLAAEAEAAQRRVERRRASLPQPRYPAELPIVARRDEIVDAIAGNPVIVVAGETGSGKTTQLPKMCLEAGRGVRGMIGHTQPRRIAARTVAERIAEELGSQVGQVVGYAVRFTDRVSDATLVKLMTDGILLAELHRDRNLAAYDTIIIDEAHERSLNIDFLLGFLKRLLPSRPDLKVIVTSATIDTERFAHHFGDAPVIDVSGRTYPVEVRYRPFGASEDDDRDQVQAICDAVTELSTEGPGDVLVFLSGEREIRDATDALARCLPDLELLPLYARLSAAEQHRVFAPHADRRVVLATNIAETSLTVPGIRYVVDAGTARISRFNRRTKVQRLPIEPVSQASANQRAGRCGRVAPGICIRLYDEADFAGRAEFTEPEVLRTNLASVILQMAALELGEPAEFPFIDPPDIRAVKDGVALLEELGALDPAAADPRGRLTSTGRRLTRLPVDPRLGRMLLEAGTQGCLSEVLTITACLSIQDPRERPAEQRDAANAAHARFADERSDFVSILNLWSYLDEQQRALSSNQFRRMCRSEFLNYLRVREWQDLRSQLRQATQELGLNANEDPAPIARVHTALLAGLLSHIGMRDPEKPEYRGARGARFAIAPGSAGAKRTPRWVMAAELVETNRMWARVAAPIDPAWAERLAPDLVRRSHGDPRWDATRGTAVAEERVTLYGLPLITGRRVDYARVDTGAARGLFVRHALVEMDWTAGHEFLRRNAELLDAVTRLEIRARRPLLRGPDALFDFYDARVGERVVSGREFDRWWAMARRRDPQLLDVGMVQLIDPATEPVTTEDFPDTWVQGDLELHLSYVFDPGAPDDGVSVEIPLALLNEVSAAGFDWHVPGMRLELVTALIRSLPRPIRRRFVPVADHARAFVVDARPDGRLIDRLDEALRRAGGDPIPPASWNPELLPPHLRVTFKVVADDGVLLAAGKDLAVLQRQLTAEMRAAIRRVTGFVERSGLRSWTFGVLPRQVEGSWGGHRVVGFPAIVDEGDTAGTRVMTSQDAQRRAMWAGVARLVALQVTVPKRDLQRRLTDPTKLALARMTGQSVPGLLDDCITAAVEHLLSVHGADIWDPASFDRLVSTVESDLPETAVAVVTFAARVLTTAAAVQRRLERITARSLQPAVSDIRAQVARLVRPRFVLRTGARRLPDVLRYLRAVDRRLDKLPEDPDRDRARMDTIQRLAAAYESAAGADPEDDEIRWMIEELRVSLFAQMLGTSFPVSEQRVRRAIERLAR